MGSELTLKHFIHPHLLEISDYQEITKNPEAIKCAACKLDPKGWVCTCKKCNYLLHFQCSQIPQRIMLPFHKEHILSLESKRSALLGKLTCNACYKTIYGYSYSCNDCDVNIHINCAKMPQIVFHKSHLHPLYLEFSLPDGTKSFLCDICKESGSNHCWLYRCKKCGFHAHLSCPTLKLTYVGSKSTQFEGKEEASSSSKVNERKESMNPKEKKVSFVATPSKGKEEDFGPTISDEGDMAVLNYLSDTEDSVDNEEVSDEGEDGPDPNYLFEQMEEELGPTISDQEIEEDDEEEEASDDEYGPNVPKERKKNSNKGNSKNKKDVVEDDDSDYHPNPSRGRKEKNYKPKPKTTKGGSKNKKNVSEGDESTDVDDEDSYGPTIRQGRKNNSSTSKIKSNKGGSKNNKDMEEDDDVFDLNQPQGRKRNSCPIKKELRPKEGTSETKKGMSYDDESEIDSDGNNDEVFDFRKRGNRV